MGLVGAAEWGARKSLRSKVLQINEIGADILCVLFDDMRGDIDGLPEVQARVIDDVSTWSNARRLIVCPTYYSYDSQLARAFGPPPKSYLRDLGRSLDPGIESRLLWSGSVASPLKSEAERSPRCSSAS